MSIAVTSAKERLLDRANVHACSRHRLFAELESRQLTLRQAAAFLRNYDAHASVLRRLLLTAAALMPEPAVGYVLENVRNEYGNGDYSKNHQAQLRDMASCAGITNAMFETAPIQAGIKSFINKASFFYNTGNASLPSAEAAAGSASPPAGYLAAAITAGAITATELMAVREFASMQKAFAPFGQAHHIWFNHVTIEKEHLDESLALALHFIDQHKSESSVLYGMDGILDANLDLYDGLLAAVT